VGVGALGALAIVATVSLGVWHGATARALAPATTIAELHTVQVLGSTVDTLNGDNNPYGVVIVPATVSPSAVEKAGDVLVTNFNDAAGVQGAGTSIERFHRNSDGSYSVSHFATVGAGPVAEAIITSGNDWVANVSANNVQILSPNGGSPAVTITSPLFAAPWGQAFNGGTHNPADGSIAAFFSTNLCSGTVDRIDIVPVAGHPTFHVSQIGSGFAFGSVGTQENGHVVIPACGSATSNVASFLSPQGMAWARSATFGGQTWSDVLYVVDPVGGRVVAYPNASTIASDMGTGVTVFQAGALKTPVGLALNPINGDLLVLIQGSNKLVEIDPATAAVVAERVLDHAAVNPRTGANSALFGLAAAQDGNGNLIVYYVDDNAFTLNALTV
jgi:hypothetical protein